MQIEIGGLHGAAVLLAAGTFCSQLLALVRDRLLAGTFGAGETLDVYYAAFRVPDFLYIGIGSLMAVTVLVPLAVERLENGDKAALARFLSSLLTAFVTILVVASAITFALMPQLAPLIAPGFSAAALAELVIFSRVLLLSPLLLGLSNLFGAITQARRQFLFYALSPILYNLGIILGIVFIYPVVGPSGLVWGVVLGAAAHLMVQVAGVLGGGIIPRLTTKIYGGDIGTVVARSVPRALAMGANQIALIVLVALASQMEAGSVAIFNLSFNLQAVPMALIGLSYSVAAFPELVRRLTQADRSQFRFYIERIVRYVLFFSLPAAMLFVVLSREIVTVVLGTGNFSGAAIALSAAALAVFSIAVIFQNIVLIFDRIYYAAGITSVPVITNIVGALVTGGSGYLLVFEYKMATVSALALAYALGVAVNMITEWCFYRRDFGQFFTPAVWCTFAKTLTASIFLGIASMLVLFVLPLHRDAASALVYGVVAALVGIVCFFLVLALLRSREVQELYQKLRK